jgi:NAD(P)-dependent dehydrogenase (short-subunit alcohol dehydrogenase family)
VRALHERGARVTVADVNAEKGQALADELGLAFAACDVRDEGQVQAAVEAAAAEHGLRIAVCCAGTGWAQKVAGSKGPHPLLPFQTIIEINLIGTFNVVRLAAARMMTTEPVDGERSVIVNTASVAAYDGQVGQAAYAASKGGIASLTLPLARDLAPSLIRVMAVAPGIFDTPLMAGLPEAARKSLATQVPHPARLGDPREYAMLVRHIVENPMLNGEVIRLDGAIRMAPR